MLNYRSYDFFKSGLLARPMPIVGYQFQDNLWCYTVSSLLAGTIATSTLAFHSVSDDDLQILP